MRRRPSNRYWKVPDEFHALSVRGLYRDLDDPRRLLDDPVAKVLAHPTRDGKAEKISFRLDYAQLAQTF
jgi:hypothetical protein